MRERPFAMLLLSVQALTAQLRCFSQNFARYAGTLYVVGPFVGTSMTLEKLFAASSGCLT